MATITRREMAFASIPVNTGSVYAKTDTITALQVWAQSIPETIIASEMAYSGTAGSYGMLILTHPR